MKQEKLQEQIQVLRAKRMGKAKQAQILVEKTKKGAVKLSTPPVSQYVPPVNRTTAQVVKYTPNPKGGGCGCSRGKK